jgi:hypothetical protein
MRGTSISVASALLVVVAPVGAEETLPTPADVRKAVERSLPYLEAGGVSWMAKRGPANTTGCVFCHRVAFMIWSHNEARRRGFAVDGKKIDEWTAWSLEKMLARGKEGGGLDTMSQMILARDSSVRWPDKPVVERKGAENIQTLWEYVAVRQKDDGSWSPEGQLTSPAEVTTRWAILALASRDGSGAASAKNRERALAFLKKVQPDGSTEAVLLRLLVERRFGMPARAAELRTELLVFGAGVAYAAKFRYTALMHGLDGPWEGPGHRDLFVTQIVQINNTFWDFAIVCYGVFIPNTWRRCAVVVAVIVVIPWRSRWSPGLSMRRCASACRFCSALRPWGFWFQRRWPSSAPLRSAASSRRRSRPARWGSTGSSSASVSAAWARSTWPSTACSSAPAPSS